MTEKNRFETWGELRERMKGFPKDTLMMTIDPNDAGHFIRLRHMEGRLVDPEAVTKDKEDYFDDEVVQPGEDSDEQIQHVVVLYAAHD